jgi:polygalacturonase
MRFERREVLVGGALLPLLATPTEAAALPHRSIVIKAPFVMPPVRIPDFSGRPRHSIMRFGAVAEDQQRTSAAIAKAIAAAHADGGGTVLVPAGEWPCGPIHLKSNVNLHLAKGATLVFSAQPADYLPPVRTSWEGIECLNYSPLIYAYDCENVAITGEGRLKATLDVWREWYARPKPHMEGLVTLYQMARAGTPTEDRDMTKGAINLRPHFIQFNRCRNILIEGIRIEDSPFWVIHPYLCRDVVIRGVSIVAHGHNNDGVDPEMSQNVLIEKCVFDQGDDAVSVKSGREDDAWRLATPARNIVVRDCDVKNGHQLMAIGSELSGGVENVWVDRCRVDPQGGTNSAFNNLLFVKTNERRGGFVRNIHMTNIVATKIAGGVLSVDTDVLYQWRTLVPTYVRKLTPIAGLHVSNIVVQDAGFRAEVKGDKGAPVTDVSLHNVRIGKVGATPGELRNVERFVDGEHGHL